MQKITNELKFTTGGLLEFMALKILSEKTYSVEEILQKLKEIGFKTPTGTLYPLLSRLRTRDLVIRGYEEAENGSAVKTYDLKEKGRQRLRELREDWKRLNSVIASLG